MLFNKNYKKGISVIELLLAAFFIISAVVALVGVAGFSASASVIARKTIQANTLAASLMESARSLRDGTVWGVDGFGTVLNGAPYHFQETIGNPPSWILSEGEETIAGFQRKIIFYNVLRDANDNIVVEGGLVDPETKKATVTVSWQEKSRNHQVSLETIFTNWIVQ
ncbi:MAG: hypothetical protein Q8N56_04365 [bacterium]|nr:hypothetical protein [bacterium]